MKHHFITRHQCLCIRWLCAKNISTNILLVLTVIEQLYVSKLHRHWTWYAIHAAPEIKALRGHEQYEGSRSQVSIPLCTPRLVVLPLTELYLLPRATTYLGLGWVIMNYDSDEQEKTSIEASHRLLDLEHAPFQAGNAWRQTCMRWLYILMVVNGVLLLLNGLLFRVNSSCWHIQTDTGDVRSSTHGLFLFWIWLPW